MRKEHSERIEKVFEHSIVDNDFENVYQIDFKYIENIPRADLIEELLRLKHILKENESIPEENIEPHS